MGIEDIVQRLARGWATPKAAVHRGEASPFPLRCIVERGPAPGDVGIDIPEPLAELWKQVASARLFEDASYGQWGLALLSPSEASAKTAAFKEERARDYRPGDLVLGAFLGDTELLLVRCDPTEADFGNVVVVLPLDSRDEWYDVADNLEVFLGEYERNQGAKFWEG